MKQAKLIDFLGAAIGILVIGGWAATTDAADGSSEWWAGFVRAYLVSVLPFSLSCGMLAHRLGKSVVNAFLGVLGAFGVVLVWSSAFEKQG